MASPQCENGYTKIANEILEALWKINLSAYESRILWYLFRKTYGFQKKTDWITLSQFSEDMGLDRRLIHRSLKKLSSKQMIVIYRDDKDHIKYGFQKDYSIWQVSSKQMTVIHRDDGLSSKQMTRVSSKQIPTKETITKETITKEKRIYIVEYKEVIDYLNQKLNSSYRIITKTKDLIKARLREGFIVEDFKKVIDIKYADWFGTDYQKFLRPQTLFGNKFESYLQQRNKTNKLSSTGIKNLMTGLEWMKEKEREGDDG